MPFNYTLFSAKGNILFYLFMNLSEKQQKPAHPHTEQNTLIYFHSIFVQKHIFTGKQSIVIDKGVMRHFDFFHSGIVIYDYGLAFRIIDTERISVFPQQNINILPPVRGSFY